MADVASISMEHQYSHISSESARSLSQEERMQRLAVGGGDLEIFKVGDTELARTGDIRTCIHGDVAGID